MSRFHASNGIQIDLTGHDQLIVYRPDGTYLTTVAAGDFIDALREFFRAEEDERLKRWRWPENPDYVVYPRADHVAVVNEQSGNAFQATRDQAHIGTGLSSAARAYFAAHPEPKPWHSARAGEVWDVDLSKGGMRSVTLDLPDGVVFRDPYGPSEISATSADILDARRVYPEVAS